MDYSSFQDIFEITQDLDSMDQVLLLSNIHIGAQGDAKTVKSRMTSLSWKASPEESEETKGKDSKTALSGLKGFLGKMRGGGKRR